MQLYIHGVPQKMSPLIFSGITLLYLIKGSIFCSGLKSNHIILIVVNISPKNLTVRLLEILKVATPILQPVQITEIRLKIMQTLQKDF
jgi:hypothetical protein